VVLDYNRSINQNSDKYYQKLLFDMKILEIKDLNRINKNENAK